MLKDPKRSQSISYAEIARAAGVSPGLVSAFFSGNQYSTERKSGIGIGAAKRRKIKETCLKLNYVPDTPYAFYCLYPDKADVGMLLNENVGDGFSNSYHSLIFEGLAKRAFETEVDLSNLFFRSQHDYMVRPEALPNPILRGAIKKVGITGQPTNYSLVCQLLRMEVALVMVGNAIPLDGIVSVVPDFREAGRSAMRVLFEHGHRSIIVAAPLGMPPDRYNGRMLREGCLSAARELDINFDESHILTVDQRFSAADIVEVVNSWEKKPTAIFCFDDNLARILSHLLEQAGYSIPRDISIIGCNDDRVNQEVRPNFSTIHLPCREIGRVAFDELTRVAVEGRPVHYKSIILPVHFVDHGTIRSIS